VTNVARHLWAQRGAFRHPCRRRTGQGDRQLRYPGAVAQAPRSRRIEGMTMGTVEVRNVNHPHSIRLVNADMHDAMKRADLAVLPKLEPGLTLTEIRKRLKAKLPQGLYPSGAKSGWWARPFSLTWRQGVSSSGSRPAHCVCIGV
jgi:hypothetical protein